MKLGVRAHDFGKHSPQALAEKILERGFQAAQVAPAKCLVGVESPACVNDEALEMLSKAFWGRIDIPVWGCYIEPSLPDEEQRLEQVRIFTYNLELAKKMGAGVVATETTHFREDESERPKAYRRMLDSVLRMAEAAAKTGVLFAVEPVALHTLNTPECTSKLISDVSSPEMRIIFDPVNLLTAQNIEKQDELWKNSFEAFGDKIAAIHLKDVIHDGEKLQFTHIGQGQVGWPSIIRETVRRYPGICLLREGYNPQNDGGELRYVRELMDSHVNRD